jgi:cyanophycin synthetase
MRTQVDIVLPEGCAVLNADDPLVLKMAELCDGEVILFAMNSQGQGVTEHLAQGGRAVLLRDSWLVLATGKEERPLLETSSIPMIEMGASPYKLESVLAAVGVAWALGLSDELIKTGIETFKFD